MRGEVVAGVGRDGVEQSLCKASEVNSDPTLPVFNVKHDTLDTAEVMVELSIALGSTGSSFVHFFITMAPTG